MPATRNNHGFSLRSLSMPDELLNRTLDLSAWDMGNVLAWAPEDAVEVIAQIGTANRDLLGVDVYEITHGMLNFLEGWDSTSIGRIQLWKAVASEVHAREAIRFIRSIVKRGAKCDGTLVVVPTWHSV
jgi:hypothetical protein